MNIKMMNQKILYLEFQRSMFPRFITVSQFPDSWKACFRLWYLPVRQLVYSKVGRIMKNELWYREYGYD